MDGHVGKPIDLSNLMDNLRKRGYWGVLVAKLIPAVRTLISIPAGMLRLEFWSYTLYSAVGIAIWNTVFIGAGYLLGDPVFSLLNVAVGQ